MDGYDRNNATCDTHGKYDRHAFDECPECARLTEEETMKVSEFKCSLCGEGMVDAEEFIGIKLDSDANFCPSNIEATDVHVCGCCLVAIKEFALKWERKDALSPADVYGWGLCW